MADPKQQPKPTVRNQFHVTDHKRAMNSVQTFIVTLLGSVQGKLLKPSSPPPFEHRRPKEAWSE